MQAGDSPERPANKVREASHPNGRRIGPEEIGNICKKNLMPGREFHQQPHLAIGGWRAPFQCGFESRLHGLVLQCK